MKKRFWILSLFIICFFIIYPPDTYAIRRANKIAEKVNFYSVENLDGKKAVFRGNTRITDFKYTHIGNISEDMIAVKLGKKYGFVDKNGREICPLNYDLVYGFSQGLAHVVLNGKSGFINKRGQVVIPIVYQNASDFSYGIAPVKKNGNYIVIDRRNRRLFSTNYDEMSSFKNNMAKVGKNGKYGYINRRARLVIPMVYDELGEFSDSLAVARQNERYGFIDTNGKLAIPMKYSMVWNEFSGGYAICSDNNSFGNFFVDTKGRKAISVNGAFVKKFSEGFAVIKYTNNMVNYIDKNARHISKEFFYDGRNFSDGLAAIKVNDVYHKYGFIDKSGSIHIPAIYDEATDFENGRAGVIVNKLAYEIDKDANVIFRMQGYCKNIKLLKNI